MSEARLDRSHQDATQTTALDGVAATPERLQRRVAPGASPASVGPDAAVVASSPSAPHAIQLFADAVSAGVHTTQSVHQAAAHGLSGSSSSLPHLAAIQHSFGRHDVGGVRAHVGGPAAEGAAAMGAHGYAAGNSVAFASSPDLHLAAHEAAHVVQQRAGVHLKGGVGEVGDTYERHADAVADLVVQGKSAENLLDTMAPAGATSSSVQRHAVQLTPDEDARAARRAIHGHPATTTRTTAAPTGPSVEGEFEGRIALPSLRFPCHYPFTPYAWVTGVDLVGSLHYRIHRAEPEQAEHGGHERVRGHGGEGDEHESEPSTAVHVGVMSGSDEHGHRQTEIEAGIATHVMDMMGGAGHFDVSGTAAVSREGATVGVGAGGGLLTVGRNPPMLVPIPAFDVHLLEWEAGHLPRFMTAEVRAGLPTFNFEATILGQTVDLQPMGEVVVHVEPNWTTIFASLAPAAGGAAVTDAALAGAVGAPPAIAIAGAVLVAAAGLFVGYEAFDQEIIGPEQLVVRARGVGFSLFHYCDAYTATWVGNDPGVGPGCAEGIRDATRDLAAFRTAHPGVDPRAQAQAWGEPLIYRTAYDRTVPAARQYLVGLGFEDHVGIVDDALHSVAVGGEHFTRYVHGGRP